jgi:hypothetical protein
MSGTYSFGPDRLRGWLHGDFSIPTAPPPEPVEEPEPVVVQPEEPTRPPSAPLISKPVVRRPKIMVSKVSVLKHSMPLHRVLELI